jgi:hypothetical protein
VAIHRPPVEEQQSNQNILPDDGQSRGMASRTVDIGLRIEAFVAAVTGTGLILFGGPALTALGIVLVVLGLVSLIPVVGLSVGEWQAT